MEFVPVLKEPVDLLRTDFTRAQAEHCGPLHPVQKAVVEPIRDGLSMAAKRDEAVFGRHMGLRMAVDQEMLSQVGRVGGLPSSHVGLDILLGRDKTISFDDVLNDPQESARMRPPAYAQMEERMKLNL